MAKPDWPSADKRVLLGTRIERVDGPAKTTGAAKYSYDINRPNMLWAKVLGSPHAHAEVVSIDTSAAEKMPGVKAVWKDDASIGLDSEGDGKVKYAGHILAAVAAETEEAATEAIYHVKVEYKVIAHEVRDNDPALSKVNPEKNEKGNVEEALGKAEVVHNGSYGCHVITHCCLEPHGQVAEFHDAELMVWPSTQAVWGYNTDRGLADAVELPQNKIRVDCQYMGAGFGSKFNVDKWGTICARLSKQTGRPVKLLLERDLELAIAGNRPSAFANVKVGAMKDGTLVAMDTELWGTEAHSRFRATCRMSFPAFPIRAA